MRHHVCVTGTGRAGTTFLVQLLTVLGLDTGFSSPTEGVSPSCSAGMELDLAAADAPYIVKGPYLCERLGAILEQGEIVVDYAIIPMRDLHAAAESRRDVMRRTGSPTADGALWGVDDPSGQEEVLVTRFYTLLLVLARHAIPVVLLDFPRLVHDPDYLLRELRKAFEIEESRFRTAFQQVARPELVHDF